MISGGRTKGPILKALLERGYLHALITDTGAAAEIKFSVGFTNVKPPGI